jgi:hypothetical protein
MKTMLAFVACLMMLASGVTQQQKAADTASSAKGSTPAMALEAKVRKSWEDYKNRDKKAFAASLAPDFSEVTDGSEGTFGKDTELSEMDHFTLAHYELSNFKVRPLGSTAALVTYSAQYDGTYDKQPLNMKTVYGEVWVKSGTNWKQLWAQETKLK